MARQRTLASVVRTARIAAGLSFRAAAEASGLSPATLSRLEGGERTAGPDSLARLARVLGLDPLDVLALDGAERGRVTIPVRSHAEALAALRAAPRKT